MHTVPPTPGGINGPLHSRVRPPTRARSRRSIYARRETYTRLLSAIIMLGVMMTWVWIFGIAAQRRAQQQIETQISPAPSSSEPDPPAVNASPPTPPAVAALPSSVEQSVTASRQPPTPVRLPELTVTSEPSGARVTVDGIGWGATPVTIRHLSVGSKRVRVTMDGYAPVQRMVHLAENHPRRSLHITLRQ